jgi:hypothetical protein
LPGPASQRPAPSRAACVLALHKRRKGIFDIFGRAQHGEPVSGECLGFLPFGQVDLRIDAAEIEQAPAKAQHAGGLA